VDLKWYGSNKWSVASSTSSIIELQHGRRRSTPVTIRGICAPRSEVI